MPTSVFRAVVVVLCFLVRETPSSVGSSSGLSQIIEILPALFLFTTISTFTAWTHCKHQHPNNLRNMLTASVVTPACGMLIDRIEQTVCICIIAAIVVAFEILFVPERVQNLKPEKNQP